MSLQELHFQWDERKDRINQQKHHIPFAEVIAVFHDPSYLSMYDPDHSIEEDRWITMGRNRFGTLIVISHTFRQDEHGRETIRIISARKASKREEHRYYQGEQETKL